MGEDLVVDGTRVNIAGGRDGAGVAVFVNASNADRGDIMAECRAAGCPPFTLVTILTSAWDEQLSPWPSEPVVTKRDHFTGGADEHLEWMLRRVVPLVKSRRRVLAGYSMAGLFALYAMYKTDAFDAIVSASGSVWFPRFIDFATTHQPSGAVKKIYMSIGDAEAVPRNKYMCHSVDYTSRLARHYSAMGFCVEHQLNPGNHFRDTTLRLARGIASVL